MLKFADINNNNSDVHNNAVNYDITIKDPIDNNIVLKRSGFTNNGADLQVFDENTFPKGEINNPVYYQMLINISNINGNVVNEKTSIPIFIKVV